jgi:uncharacterized protein
MIDIALFLAGVMAGTVNAIAGGGVLFVFGGLLFAGLSPLAAATTTSVTTWPGALMATWGYRKDIRKIHRRYFMLVIPTAIGATIGATLLINTPSTAFERIIPWLILVSVLLFAFQPQLHRYIHKPAHLRIKSPFVGLVFLLILTALYGGYFGAGFGFIVLALLSFTHLKNVYQINGLKNLITASISLACMCVFALTERIEWSYVLWPTVGAIIGGFMGAKLAHRLSPHITRVVVISIGLILFCLLSYRQSS